MTYCVAVRTNDGLVFCSDSRTNAGPDMLSSYSKMHVFQPADDRLIVVLSAGNLATTQGIIARLEDDLKEDAEVSLSTVEKMSEVAKYVGGVSRHIQEQSPCTTGDKTVDTTASLIVGGQIGEGNPAIYMIYAEGNFISDSDTTPFLQIGESKYGKPILDRILERETSLEDAARCAVVSMDSTLKSNATVGPPIEVLVYENSSFKADHHITMQEDDNYLLEVRSAWNEAVNKAFSGLPRFEWEQRSVPTLQAVSEDYKL